MNPSDFESLCTAPDLTYMYSDDNRVYAAEIWNRCIDRRIARTESRAQYYWPIEPASDVQELREILGEALDQ